MPVLLYDGPSLFDGAPIVVLATGHNAPSTNVKTGAMIQTYILRKDISPTEALRTKNDASICGDCRHRIGSCYVVVSQGPTSVYRAYRRGYELPSDTFAKNRLVRLGAYGDPGAVPLHVWEPIAEVASGITGYTHAWKQRTDLIPYCMASVDTPNEATAAQAMGWRTFRIRPATDPKPNVYLLKEASCPASVEQGHKLQCSQCLACGGTSSANKANIVINVHGAKWKADRYLSTL